MNISVCITVKNEAESISKLLDSLLSQTISLKSFEILVCDGNSTDNTCEIIKKYKSVILIKTKKLGIAAGRNVAIEHSKGEIIAMVDAGCVAKKDWLENLTKPFKVNTKRVLVSGYYEMPHKYPLQQVLSIYQGTPPERYNEHKFIPSARSVAFSKSTWKEVGKFNERLVNGGEDTEFFYKCVKSNVKIIRIKEARVVWEETANLNLFFSLKKFYSYAKGDAKTKIWYDPVKLFASHNIKVLSIFSRYVVFVYIIVLSYFSYIPSTAFYILFGLYLIYPIYKWFDVVKSLKGRLWLPIVQVTSDIAVMAGFISGIIGL